jgi:hypothetical protein
MPAVFNTIQKPYLSPGLGFATAFHLDITGIGVDYPIRAVVVALNLVRHVITLRLLLL